MWLQHGTLRTKEGGQRRTPTCLQLLPQSELMYISSLYSTSLEPRFPEGRDM